MISPTSSHLPDELARLRDLVHTAGRIVAFTGAGISTESGVPDFRSPGSPWLVHKPIPFHEFMDSPDARYEAWRRKFAMDDIYAGAEPGRGHHALATLFRSGALHTIVTQNIDNLHQRAGVPGEAVVELHGNGTYALCLDCGRRHELVDIRRRFDIIHQAPICDNCEGPVKSATISFGQQLPGGAIRRAQEAMENCDLLLAIGSSLVVQPAARFPLIAKAAGAKLVILNRDPTPLDRHADLLIRGDIGDVLSAVV